MTYSTAGLSEQTPERKGTSLTFRLSFPFYLSLQILLHQLNDIWTLTV